MESLREYFYNKLKNLKTLTGLKQFEYFQAAESPEREINNWLDEMEKACQKYKLIPLNTVKSIVDKKVLHSEITGLYPKYVYQWLSAYWSELDVAKRQKIIQDYNKSDNLNPNESNPLSPEKAQKYIEEIKENLKKFESQNNNKKALKPSKKASSYERNLVDCEYCSGTGHKYGKNCGFCENGKRIKTIIK